MSFHYILLVGSESLGATHIQRKTKSPPVDRRNIKEFVDMFFFFFSAIPKESLFSLFLFFFLIEVSLINNVVLISDKALRGKHRQNT